MSMDDCGLMARLGYIIMLGRVCGQNKNYMDGPVNQSIGVTIAS